MVIIGSGVSGSAVNSLRGTRALSTLCGPSNLRKLCYTAVVCYDAVICASAILSAIEQQLLASGDATRDDCTTMIWFALSVWEKCMSSHQVDDLYDASLAARFYLMPVTKTITHAILASNRKVLIAVAAQAWMTLIEVTQSC